MTRADWSNHYIAGNSFRRLGDEERALLAEHVPAPAGGRALDLGCGTGELAAYLVSLGYIVDAVDFAEGARAERAGVEQVRWLCLDIERDDPAPAGRRGVRPDLPPAGVSVRLGPDAGRARPR